MGNQVYITEEEKGKCQKVVDAFAKLYEEADFIVVSAGDYGFAKLQYFKLPNGFDNVTSFMDSQSLFDDLWEEWLGTQLYHLSLGTEMEDMKYEEILKRLPEEKRNELLGMRLQFAEKAGIGNSGKSFGDM